MTASSFLVKVVDSNGCLVIKIIDCPLETFIITTEDGLGLETEDGFTLVFL